MNDFTRELHQRQEQMTRDLRGLIADAEALLRHAARDASSEFAEARARLEAGLAAAKTRLLAAEQTLLRQVGDAAGASEDYVHRNPWTALGVSAGVGLLAGLLFARR